MVPMSTMIAMAVSMLFGLILPAAIYFIVKKRFGGGRKAFFTGCATMFVFAFVLEALVHSAVLGGSLGETIQGNIWLYGLYGGAMAALFEETGRYLAFRFVLKKQMPDDANAWMYGAGHGGFEAFYILFMSGINNLALVAMINSGNLEAVTAGLSGAALTSIETAVEQMQTMSWGIFMLAPVERIAAILLHLSFSVLVWFAVKEGKIKFYGLSLLLHFLVDFVTVVVNSYLTRLGDAAMIVTEIIVWAMALGCMVIAWKVWKAHKTVAEEAGTV